MKKGFTLIELLVVIAIIAILAAILFPVFAQARDKARQTACLSNVKQIATALQLYADDYDESFPAACDQESQHFPWGLWGTTTNKNEHSVCVVLLTYCKNTKLFHCPSARRSPEYEDYYGFNSYMWNGGVMDMYGGQQAIAGLANPSAIALTIEMPFDDQWNRLTPFYHLNGHWWSKWDYVGGLHASNTVVNLAYADGHAKGVKFATLETKDFGFYQNSNGESRLCNQDVSGNPGWTMFDCYFKG